MRQARPVTPHAILTEHLQQAVKELECETDNITLIHHGHEAYRLAQPLDDYLDAHSTQPSEALRGLERASRELDWDAAYADGRTDLQLEQEMVSGALEGQFLKMLIAIAGARRVLEIGSFTGYASLAMAEALPEDGELVACEYDRFTAEFARKHLDATEAGQRVDIRVGDARETLAVLAQAGQPFDLAFVDADKPGYLDYYHTLLEHDLIPVGKLICVDNTLFQGEVYGSRERASENGRALMAFNEAVRDDPRTEQVLLPLRDGLTLIRRVA